MLRTEIGVEEGGFEARERLDVPEEPSCSGAPFAVEHGEDEPFEFRALIAVSLDPVLSRHWEPARVKSMKRVEELSDPLAVLVDERLSADDAVADEERIAGDVFERWHEYWERGSKRRQQHGLELERFLDAGPTWKSEHPVVVDDGYLEVVPDVDFENRQRFAPERFCDEPLSLRSHLPIVSWAATRSSASSVGPRLRPADPGRKIRTTEPMSESGFEPLPEAIANRYGVAIPPRWERLLSDTTGGVFRGGEFVVRVEPPDPESVGWEHALLRFLANEIEQVVAPLAALDGSTFYLDGGHVVSVFPFLEGEELRSHEAFFRQELPALLARLHRHAQAWPMTEQRPGVPSLRNRNWDRNDWWDWSLVEKPASLVRAFEELREWVADADDLCVCAIHGDFHTGNVLVRDGRVAGIVDWQYSRRDWPALELAGMVWDLSWDGSSTTVDRALRDDLIQKYVDSGGPGEAAAVVPMMRLESLVSALISLTRAAKGLPWNREFTRLLIGTLDELA